MEKQRGKRYLIMIITQIVNMILTLLTKMIAINMQAFIVQVELSNFKRPILGGGVCLAIFLAFNKQFWGQSGHFLQIYIGVYI